MRKIDYSASHTSVATVCDVLNEGSDDIDDLRAKAERARLEVVSLRHELSRLHVSFEVLAAVLAERGVVDFAVLSPRIDATIAERESAAHGGVECVDCHKRVPVPSTNVTARGPVCNECFVPGRV